jgi:divalent metal cation (Fe/Co/Zn/Cd) transporter
LPLASRVIKGSFTKTGVTMAHAKKKIVRREWSKEDVRQMKTMAKAKAGVTKISKSLKRTLGATSVMAAKLGISLSMRA